jgi:hypothetical protein
MTPNPKKRDTERLTWRKIATADYAGFPVSAEEIRMPEDRGLPVPAHSAAISDGFALQSVPMLRQIIVLLSPG